MLSKVLKANYYALKFLLGRSWVLLGCSWGALGVLLGTSWGALESSWGALGASWGALGSSWDALGVLLGPLGWLLVSPPLPAASAQVGVHLGPFLFFDVFDGLLSPRGSP